MLASNPANMVNQKQADLGIPNRFKLTPSRFSYIYFSADRTFDGWTFNAGAPAYGFRNGSGFPAFGNGYAVTFNGAGIVLNGGSVTLINNGTVSFNNSSSAGPAFVINDYIWNFNDTSTAATSNIFNEYSLTFKGNSTAANSTITNDSGSAVLAFRNTSTAGNAHISNDGAQLFFYDTSSAGSATINNTRLSGLGVMNFFNSSTASNATITNDFLLNFGDTSTAGNATITTTGAPSTFTAFSQRANGGNARFITLAGGIVDFSFSTGPANDHKLSAGSFEGAGNYFLGANQLTVGSNNLSTTVSGIISDCGTGADCEGAPATGGSLVKVGTGVMTLSGINAYTGATTIDAGALVVDGSTAASSLTTVNAGATLAGSGTVGAAAINGGTLAPGSAGGSAFGPLTVQGSLSFTASSTYMIQVSPSNAGRTNVSGGATLGGASVSAVFQAGSYVNRQYTILNATGGIAGTFNPTVISNNANIQSMLSYDANNAYLNINLLFSTPPGGSLNVNQRNVANALTNYFNTTGGIPFAFASLNANGLTQSDGELGTAPQQTSFDAMKLFLGLLTDPFHGNAASASSGGAQPFASEDDGVSGYTARARGRSKSEREALAAMDRKAPLARTFDQRWNAWAAGFGGTQTTDGNAVVGSNRATSRIFGVAAGADYIFSPDTIAGFALAGGGTNFQIANALGSGSSDLFQAGAFVRHTRGAAYVIGALAYGWQDVTTDRTVTIAGIDRLRANFNANAFSGRLEGDYRFIAPVMGGVGVTPYAAGQFVALDLPGYAEQALSGANTFALSYAPRTVTDTRSELGARADKSFALQTAMLTLRGRAAWVHDYNPDRAISATFQTLPGASFVVNGASQARDAALTTASAEVAWPNGWSVATAFEGEFSDVTRSVAGKGVIRRVW